MIADLCGRRLGYNCRPCRKLAGHVDRGDPEHDTNPGGCSAIWEDSPGDYAFPRGPSPMWAKLEGEGLGGAAVSARRLDVGASGHGEAR